MVIRNDGDGRLGLANGLQDPRRVEEKSQGLAALASALDETQTFIRTCDGTIHFWSRGCETLFGFSRTEAEGRIYHDLLRTVFPEPRETLHQRLFERGRWHGSVTHITKNGAGLVVNADWVLWLDGGDEARVIETNCNITEHKQAEFEREKQFKSLQEKNRELTQFSSIAAHDLQAPLRSIQLQADLARRRVEKAADLATCQAMGNIMESAKAMGLLIESLLHYAQIGEDSEPMVAVDLTDELKTVLGTLWPTLDENRATVTWNTLPTVRGDASQLRQLFQNLIGNAVKYRKPGEAPAVKIECECASKVHTISVKDNGIGMAAQHQAGIFVPLKRLHGSEIPGTGMGLAICKKIVEHHGGKIWVESAPSEGSTFFFTIPF